MKQGTSESGVRSGALAGVDTGFDKGMKVLSYLLGGVAFYGGLGWVGDHFLGTGFLLPVGIVLGAALGVFVIIRRYGSPSQPTVSAPKPRRRLVRPSQEYVIRRIPR